MDVCEQVTYGSMDVCKGGKDVAGNDGDDGR